MLFCSGFEAIKYRCQVRLHVEDSGLWFGENGWNELHDDTVRSDQVLQSTRGHPRHGLQRKR